MPSIRYRLSVRITISWRRGKSLSNSSKAKAAASSMRLLVVAGSLAPSSRTDPSSNRNSAPQPPGPGLPLQAPSQAAPTTRPG